MGSGAGMPRRRHAARRPPGSHRRPPSRSRRVTDARPGPGPTVCQGPFKFHAAALVLQCGGHGSRRARPGL
eukprot:756506-Hanusia_phi.AAC.1